MLFERQLLICIALLWLSGTALRVTILAVPPVIPLIQADLHMSATEIGLLSGLPVMLFAVAALPGSLLISRLGARTTLIGGLLVLAVGAGLRGGSSSLATLYATTTVMGLGVAIVQPSMPVLVREWLPSRVGFGTAVYSNGLLVGEILPVWMAAVLLPLLGDGWRLELSAWSVPVLFVALLIIIEAPRSNAAGGVVKALPWWPDWKNPLIWLLGMMFGSINAMYYASNAFLPPYLHSLGRDDLINSALTALNLGQLPASLLILATANRLERRAWPYLVAGLVTLISVSGLVFIVGAWTIIWAALLGCAVGAAFVLALTLPPVLAKQEDVARTSAAMFTLSYAIAMAIALACGAVWDITGLPSSAFAPVGLCTIALSALAWILKTKGQLR
jgi:MFS transporter, CP family, cyanate transporter